MQRLKQYWLLQRKVTAVRVATHAVVCHPIPVAAGSARIDFDDTSGWNATDLVGQPCRGGFRRIVDSEILTIGVDHDCCTRIGRFHSEGRRVFSFFPRSVRGPEPDCVSSCFCYIVTEFIDCARQRICILALAITPSTGYRSSVSINTIAYSV